MSFFISYYLEHFWLRYSVRKCASLRYYRLGTFSVIMFTIRVCLTLVDCTLMAKIHKKTPEMFASLSLQRVSQNLSTALVIKPLKILVESHSVVEGDLGWRVTGGGSLRWNIDGQRQALPLPVWTSSHLIMRHPPCWRRRCSRRRDERHRCNQVDNTEELRFNFPDDAFFSGIYSRLMLFCGRATEKVTCRELWRQVAPWQEVHVTCHSVLKANSLPKWSSR